MTARYRCRSGLLVGLLTLAACAATPEPTMSDRPDPRYWRHERILGTLEHWQRKRPDLVRVEAVGRTHLGRDIRAVRVSGAGGEPVPVLLFLAAQHANEANGVGAVMKLLELLLEGHGRDAEVTAFVDGLELWFVPVVNVDGHVHVLSGATGWREWRKNGRDNDGDGKPFGPADGVDLNRNWDHRWVADLATAPKLRSYKGPAPFSEPETCAIRDLVRRIRPLIVVDFHSPGKITPPNKIFWPWLWRVTKEVGPDASIYRGIAQGFAARTETEEDGVFYDGDWYGYDTLPKAQNWIYRETGACALLVEISMRYWWEGPVVDRIAERVARGSLSLLERARHGPGLVARVTDAETGHPLVAEVRVREHHDPRIGPRWTRAKDGIHWRLLDPGEVTVEVLAEGHENVERTVTIEPTGWIRLDVRLGRTVP